MLAHRTPWALLLLLWIAGSTYWHVCRVKQLCADNVVGTSNVTVNVDSSATETPGLTTAPADGTPAVTSLDADTVLTDLTDSATTAVATGASAAGLSAADAPAASNVVTNQAATSAAVAPPTTLPTTEAGLAEAEKFASVFQPISLYFPLSGSRYIRTDETDKFFAEATTYLKKNPRKTLVLTGYTDNTGPDDANLRLSRRRAESVQRDLRRSGIRPEQIRVEAKGEADPRTTNETLAGRRANRRVTAVVK